MKDGLSSNKVNAILKDRYGLMWIATEDGLNQYDGTTFRIYRNDPDDSSSIQANEITTLYEDRQGILWIGSLGGSISIYNRKMDNFTRLKGKPELDGINSAVKIILGDSYGKIWVGHYSGLSVINPQNHTVYNFPIKLAEKSFLNSSVVLSLYEDSKRRLWVGTKEGLLLYYPNSRSFIRCRTSAAESRNATYIVRSIGEDSQGNLLVGTNFGLKIVNGAPHYLPSREPEIRTLPGLKQSIIYAISRDLDGKMWVGTDEGILILDNKLRRLMELTPDKRNRHSIARKEVLCIYIDRNGINWIGCSQAGISRYDKNLSLFQLKESNPFDVFGLTVPKVTAFEEAPNKCLYVGTDGGGLLQFNKISGLFNQIKLNSVGLSSNKLAVLALERSSSGRLWVGTYGNGLFGLEPSGKIRQFKKGTGRNSLSSNNIFTLTEDKNGKLWIGTNGEGVNIYDPTSGSFTRMLKEIEQPGDIKLRLNGFIRSIAEDHSGNMWIASHGTGVALFTPNTQKIEIYDSYNSGLSDNTVHSICVDRTGNIWLGTARGLNLFNKKTNSFTAFSTKEGLANDVVYKILEDKKGLLWLSTNTGISSFNPKTRKFNNYSYLNGLQQSSFNSGAGLVTRDGSIFFGGLEGFNYFSPGDLRKNNRVPALLFTELKVSNETVTPRDFAGLKEHISIAKEIVLDYKDNFSLSFVALNFTSPAENRYSYKLEGFEKHWINSGTVHTAFYTNLDPGQYIFRVRACNNDGVWNMKGTSIRIIIRPPFYLTYYAYLTYFFLGVGIFIYARRRSIRKIEAKFLLQQERIAAQQAIEQERKDAQRVRELDNLKIKFLTNLSHEFRTPISLIMGPVDNLLSWDSNSMRQGQLHVIKRNARRLLNLVNQLLDFRKMEEQELKLHAGEGDIIGFIREVSESFRDIAERKRIDLEVDSPISHFFTRFDHDKIERILFNLLSNAFKFTMEGGHIKVGMYIEEATQEATKLLRIDITDSGIGIPTDKLNLIFERFFQNTTEESLLNQGTGLGLSITKEFVQMHGGFISVKSELGKGSTFSVELPLTPLGTILPAEVIQFTISPDFSNEEKDKVNLSDNAATGQVEVLNHQPHIPIVLLVEDNEDFRFYLRENLKLSYRIIEATNGKEGWQKALTFHPQLIVSDISMPEMDGISLCKKIKADKRTSHIPVILLTALTAEDEQIKGLETGANDYMTKPFNFEILNAKIKNHLHLSKTQKETYTRHIQVLSPEVKVESEGVRFMQRVVAYIDKNIDKPTLSVEELSKHLGMSRSNLYNRIMELTGQAPVEFIRNKKLEKAVVLLEKSDMNISQIGYAAGFATPNYFTRAFKAKFNMLPSEYMQSKKNINSR